VTTHFGKLKLCGRPLFGMMPGQRLEKNSESGCFRNFFDMCLIYMQNHVCPIQMHADFAEGRLTPLAMMGVKRFRVLPDF